MVFLKLSARFKTLFFLLSACTEELISPPKIITFLPNPLATDEGPRLSNSIPYPDYLDLPISTLLTNVTVRNKIFSSVG